MSQIEVAALDPSRLDEAGRLLTEFKQLSYGETATADKCRESLIRLLNSGYAHGLLAYRDGAAVGLLTYSWAFSASRGLPILRIQDIYTSATARRQGVAQALLERCAALGQEVGAQRLQLETDTDNGAARQLYSRFGFEWIAHKEVYMLPLQG